MKRIGLFLVTNVAVLVVLSASLHLLGVDRMLAEQQAGLNVTGLLVMAAVIGMGGSIISLALSKWMAKRGTGARVIEQPSTRTEQWLVHTVARHADAAGIGMPEVAIESEKGDLMFFHRHIIHRGGRILEPGSFRHSFVRHYIPKSFDPWPYEEAPRLRISFDRVCRFTATGFE